MAKEPKKQTLTDLYPNEGAVLKRVHTYLIAGNSNQARSLIEDYIVAKRQKRANREEKRTSRIDDDNDKKEEKKPNKPEINKERAIHIVKSIENNYDEDVVKDIEALRERSKDPKTVKEVADYDRAMAKRKELKEKFDI